MHKHLVLPYSHALEMNQYNLSQSFEDLVCCDIIVSFETILDCVDAGCLQQFGIIFKASVGAGTIANVQSFPQLRRMCNMQSDTNSRVWIQWSLGKTHDIYRYWSRATETI